MECQSQTMSQAPEYKSPIGAVPKSSYQHGDQKEEVGVEFAFSVSAQWDIDVVFEPTAEGDMPFAPEYCDVGGSVWVLEILFESVSQHQSYPYGNV